MQWEDRTIPVVDFTRLSTRCKYIALMPQWDLLDLLVEAGRAHPGFSLRMRTEARELIGTGGADGRWTRVDGLQATGPDGRSISARRPWSGAMDAARGCARCRGWSAIR
ncbi:MAG: hypothetical protein ABI277_19440 [Burkholderiaceae bacterium]